MYNSSHAYSQVEARQNVVIIPVGGYVGYTNQHYQNSNPGAPEAFAQNPGVSGGYGPLMAHAQPQRQQANTGAPAYGK
jgi:hypothetical protein